MVADGAMGTLLYAYGVNQCLSALNLTQPALVASIHQAYLEAGARIIQTNTYGANPFALAHYGLEKEFKAILRQGISLAKEAVRQVGLYPSSETGFHPQTETPSSGGERAYVLATIGGIRGSGHKTYSLKEIERSFLDQLEIFLSEGVDGLLLETYTDLEELSAVLSLARKNTSLPIIAQVSMEEPGVLKGGYTLGEAFHRLEALGADGVGVNCRLGPYHTLRSLEQVPLPNKAFLSAYPNASKPAFDDGRFTYQCEPDYFARQAKALVEQGVRLIGGCCGTTPEHIRAVARLLDEAQPILHKGRKQGNGASAPAPVAEDRIHLSSIPAHGETATANGETAAANGETAAVPGVTPANGALPSPRLVTTAPAAEGMNRGAGHLPLPEVVKERHSVIVELDPPKHLDLDSFLQGAEALAEAGIDALTMADNSLATPRVSNMATAVLIRERTNLLPLVHLTCRDRNLIGLESHLLGLASLGIDHILAITGDPTKVGDLPGARSVYDLSSFGLIQMIKQMNAGLSFSGKPLKRNTSFTVAAAFNPNVHHLDKAIRRLEKKIEAGADFFISQPVYDHEQLEKIHQATKHLTKPIYIGIMPLTSHRNAEFLHHEVPGIKLSDEVRRRMAATAHDPDLARREGLAIAKELIDTAFELFNGLYLITPFLRYDMSVELVQYIHRKEKERTLTHGQNLV